MDDLFYGIMRFGARLGAKRRLFCGKKRLNHRYSLGMRDRKAWMVAFDRASAASADNSTSGAWW